MLPEKVKEDFQQDASGVDRTVSVPEIETCISNDNIELSVADESLENSLYKSENNDKEKAESPLLKIKRHSLADKDLPPLIYPRWKADE